MRFLTIATAALAAAQGAFAVDIFKNIIMTFPSSTPDNIVSDAMDQIREAGGHVTHVYKIIKYDIRFDCPPLSVNLPSISLCLRRL